MLFIYRPGRADGGGRSPSYFEKRARAKKPQDLLTEDCIGLRLPTFGGVYLWKFDRGKRELKVRVEGQLVFNAIRMILDAALAGLGLACLPEDLVQARIAEGKLIRVLDKWCRPFPGYHLYYPSRRHVTPAFAVVLAALRYRVSRTVGPEH